MLSVLLPCFKNLIVYSWPILRSWHVSHFIAELVKNNILSIIIQACYNATVDFKIKEELTTSFHRLDFNVGKRDWSSPHALFITRAFVISFDVFSCISSVRLCCTPLPCFSWIIIWVFLLQGLAV